MGEAGIDTAAIQTTLNDLADQGKTPLIFAGADKGDRRDRCGRRREGQQQRGN